jgi:hypothetical protein
MPRPIVRRAALVSPKAACRGVPQRLIGKLAGADAFHLDLLFNAYDITNVRKPRISLND